MVSRDRASDEVKRYDWPKQLGLFPNPMKRIFVPTRSGSDWQPLLAEPIKHWKKGKSAMTAAACWESAGTTFPPEVAAALAGAAVYKERAEPARSSMAARA